VFENKILRRVFGDKESHKRRQLRNEDRLNPHSLPILYGWPD